MDHDKDYRETDDDDDDSKDPAEILSGYHREFLMAFDKKDSALSLDAFFDNQPTYIQASLSEPGMNGRTVLHAMFRWPKKFRTREALFKWVMKRYPALYREEATDAKFKTLLHIGVNWPLSVLGMGYLITFFVKNFPLEASFLLRSDKSNDLVELIMPYILDCKLEHLRMLFPRDGEIEPQVDNNGNTMLHLAARYNPQTAEDTRGSQLQLVKTIFEWCPQALEKINRKGDSPYQHRLRTYFDSTDDKRDGNDIPLRDDSVAYFLKDRIMRLKNADATIRLLHCNGNGMQSNSDRLSLVNAVLERSIHLDLVEVESRDYPVSERALRQLFERLKFENILQYVQIPWYPFSTKAKVRASTFVQENEEDGAGRKDFRLIFKLLREHNVQKIIKLIVNDDDETPHSDEILEELRDFEIEVLDWKKVDLCSYVIKNGAPGVRKLFLYSSGSNAVLRSWSGSDGLKELEQVSILASCENIH